MANYHKSIESFVKSLYSGKVNSSKFGLVISKVTDVSIVESTATYNRYQISYDLSINGNATSKSIVFDVPQFNTTNIKKVSINVAMINKIPKIYSTKSKIIGASFKGLYINTRDRKVRIGTYEFELDELTVVLGMLEEGNRDGAKTLYSEEKIAFLEDFHLNRKVYGKIKLIYDIEDLDDRIINSKLWNILVSISSGEMKEEMKEVTPYDAKMFDYNKGLLYHLDAEFPKLKDSFYSFLNQRGNIYPSIINNSIKRYFLGNLAIINMIQYTQDSNPLTMISQSRKLYFLDSSTLGKMRVNSPYMDGILDPIRTMESHNINIRHELTLGCDFDIDNIMMQVYDKEFNEIKIPYDEYINSYILSYENINYKSKTIHLNRNGKYKAVKRARYYELDNLDDVRYYRHQSTLLSASTALMPMINRNDTTRDLLQAHFNTQAIPVVGSRPNIVTTKYPKEMIKYDNSVVTSNVEGEVVGVIDSGDAVKIKKENGEVEFVEVKKYNTTKAHTTNIYVPAVKVGDKIKEGDSLFLLNSYQNKELSLTVPLLTAYSTLRNYEIDDGYVLSESAAKKLAHLESMTFTVKMKKEKSFFDSEFKLPEIGDRIEDGDAIFKYLEYQPEQFITSHFEKAQKMYSEVTYKLPPYSFGGRVTKINIYINPLVVGDEEEKKIKEWQDRCLKSRRQFYDSPALQDKFPASKENDECNYIIKIECEYYNKMKLSDKMTNRSSNKGVQVITVPDSEMLKTEDGKIIEVVMPALSMASRKNTFNITECKLTKLSTKMLQIIKEGRINEIKDVVDTLYQEIPENLRTREYLLENYEQDGFLRIYIDPFDSDLSDEKINEMLEKCGIPNEGKEYLIDQVTGKRLRNPVLVGYNEYERLHFIAELKGSATPLVTYTTKMVMGIGHHRKVGQKFGEQEVDALLASGKEDLVVATTLESNKKDIKITSELNNLLLRLNTREVED